MTGMELATAARFGLNPIVIVLNNAGYGTERPMRDGSFNNIPGGNYARLPDFLGAGRGYNIHTEAEFDEALISARQHTDNFCILDVHLDPFDMSPALKRLTENLAKRVQR